MTAIKSIPAGPIRSTIAVHDDPSIAIVLGSSGARDFLFVVDDSLSHLLREADRGYMLTNVGITEDLIRDRLRAQTRTAADVVRRNVQRHIEERELYDLTFGTAAGYRFSRDAASVQNVLLRVRDVLGVLDQLDRWNEADGRGRARLAESCSPK